MAKRRDTSQIHSSDLSLINEQLTILSDFLLIRNNDKTNPQFKVPLLLEPYKNYSLPIFIYLLTFDTLFSYKNNRKEKKFKWIIITRTTTFYCKITKKSFTEEHFNSISFPFVFIQLRFRTWKLFFGQLYHGYCSLTIASSSAILPTTVEQELESINVWFHRKRSLFLLPNSHNTQKFIELRAFYASILNVHIRPL